MSAKSAGGRPPVNIEREQALNRAKHPIESRLGGYILRQSGSEDKLLLDRLNRIDKYYKRSQVHNENQRKLFLSQQEQYRLHPSLIVERSPSADARRGGYAGENSRVPHYMAQLASKTKQPSMLPTIDAFVVQSNRKKNIWEFDKNDQDAVKFRSVVPPSGPLRKDEKKILHRGLTMHETKVINSAPQYGRARVQPFKQLPRDIRSAICRVEPINYRDDFDSKEELTSDDNNGTTTAATESPVFITQGHGVAKKQRRKSVKFANDVLVHDIDPRYDAWTNISNNKKYKRIMPTQVYQTDFPPIMRTNTYTNTYADVRPRYNAPILSHSSPAMAILSSASRTARKDPRQITTSTAPELHVLM
ncbi:uncharacterized protein LOC141907712 [Tubulanus polymorphus]|uniref:uncharacterized protein LOC141907712 n=1 Tax=Tubulanus polymorphus TaxID=672921 RepID=UPI003DA517AF